MPRSKPYTQAQLDCAARAVHEVTGGSIKFGPRRRTSTTVSAAAVAQAALDAVLATPSEEQNDE